MPFTLSHPAAVLPFVRPPFGATALVAGAVAPDMPYFVGAAPIPVSAQSWYEPFLNATTSHTPAGAITVALPYALILYGLARLARRPVGAALPAFAAVSRQRRPHGAGAALRAGAWILLSLLIGIATHLAWDSFTHGDGYLVTRVPWLNGDLVGSLTRARALQHVSTVGGLVVIAVYAWRRWPRVPADDAKGRGHLGLLCFVGGIVTIAGALAGTVRWWDAAVGLSTGQVIEGVLSDAAKGAGLALVGALGVYVVAWWAHRCVTHGVVSRRRPPG